MADREVMDALDGLTRVARASQEEVTRRLDDFEAKIQRPGMLSGGDRAAGDLVAERRALAQFVRSGDDSQLNKLQQRHNSMSVDSDPDGGYLVMPALSAGMTKKLFDSTPMRRLARVETITSGDAWIEPVDFDDIGATWVSERGSRPETTSPKLNLLTVPVNEIYALAKVTQRLLDNDFDLGTWLDNKMADKFSRTEGLAAVSGNGAEKPLGFLSATIVSTDDASRPWPQLQYVPSGAATDLTADALVDMTWKLRAPYRQGAVWLMNSNTASKIDKMKDGNGNYLWRNGMAAGVPPSLLNYPVEFSEDMPDVGANAHPVAFGNWKLGYVIVDKPGLRLIRDNLTDKPHVLFYSFRRVGGGIANSDAIKVQKVATT